MMAFRPGRIAFTAAAWLLTGCHLIKPELPENEVGFRPEPFLSAPLVERTGLEHPLWGLALSGGGPRAATVALGAMKALYDGGLLDSLDIVSSVSGGGYTAYWLYSRELRNPSKSSRTKGHFGAGSFADSAFIVGLCDVATTSNFMPYWKAIPRLLVGKSPSRQYDEALLRTFGQANYNVDLSYGPLRPIDEYDPPVQLHHLRSLVRSGRIPNLIINTNVISPRPVLGYFDGLYEFTPLHRGNAWFQNIPWNDSTSFGLRDAVRISAAASALGLKKTIPRQVAGHSLPRITLSDGGHAENLGVVALVRRRVRNIIVIDAERDPTLKLEGYFDLKRRLAVWGDSLVVDSLEALRRSHDAKLRPKRGAYLGYIRSSSGTYHAKVYYLKLSLPLSIDTVLAKDAVWEAKANAEHDRVFDALKHGKKHADGDSWRCENLAPLKLNLRMLATREMRIFVPAKTLGPMIPSTWKSYPQGSTFNLNYDLTRTFALVGLGHFLGSELASLIRTKRYP